MYGYIYKTTNLVNNKVYIGQRKGNFSHSYLGSGFILKRAINKEGKDKFKVEVLVYAEDKNKINEYEKSCIAEYKRIFGQDALYNIAKGGNGGATRMGRTNSKAMNKKISLAHKGRPSPRKGKTAIEIYGFEIAKSRYSKVSGTKHWLYGKHRTKTERSKISSSLKDGYSSGKIIPSFLGRLHKIETKQKMSLNHANVSGTNNPFYGRTHLEETRKRLGKYIRKPRGKYNINNRKREDSNAKKEQLAS